MAESGHVFHYRHGWIPIDHVDAKGAKGIKSRGDVAKAVVTLPHIKDPAAQRGAKVETAAAAHRLGAQDLLPKSVAAMHNPNSEAPAEPLHPDTVALLRGGSADAHLVADASGTHFTPERQALHNKIVNDVVAGHAARSTPAFVMLGGGPASGKTKAADAAAHDFPDAITINPDDVKLALPEYKKMSPDQAAGFTHEESSYVSKRITEAALASRAHVILDAVGDSSPTKVRSKIDQARGAGYSVHARYVTVPTHVAQERARLRGIKSGRVVNPVTVGELHAGVSNVFPQVLHHFDTASLHDNSGSGFTKILSASRGGKPVIHDPALYNGFLGKAAG